METCNCLELMYRPHNDDEPVADAALSLAEEEAQFILGGGCVNWSERAIREPSYTPSWGRV